MLLLLMRHASAMRSSGLADHERPLSPKGAKDAAAVGGHLTRHGLLPRRIVSSTAVRAADTARLVASAASPPRPIERSADLYHGGIDELLRAATEVEADAVLVVAHQPALSQTVESLTGTHVAMGPADVVCVEIDEPSSARPSGRVNWMLTPAGVVR